MKRHEWTFFFQADRLQSEASRRAGEHEAHADYWADRYDALSQELQGSAKIETVKVTGGENQVLRVDPGLQAMANDAKARRDAHQLKADEYERWAMVFGASRDQGLHLHMDDVAFFLQPVPELKADS